MSSDISRIVSAASADSLTALSTGCPKTAMPGLCRHCLPWVPALPVTHFRLLIQVLHTRKLITAHDAQRHFIVEGTRRTSWTHRFKG